MSKEFVQKISSKLADLADDVISQSACLTFWGEVKLPECMRRQYEEKHENKATE